VLENQSITYTNFAPAMQGKDEGGVEGNKIVKGRTRKREIKLVIHKSQMEGEISR